jgi:hypothetical protein
MTWLRRLLGMPPPSPVMLRVSADDGRLVEVVDLTVTWHPSGLTSVEKQRTAHGLAIVPWRTRESRARISIAGGSGRAEVIIARDRAEPDRVTEVRVSTTAAGRQNELV